MLHHLDDGKRTSFADFRQMKNRGGSGVTCQKISEKTGRLASIATVSEDDDVMIITSAGTMIRVPVAGIPTYSRGAGGVIVMRLEEGAEIISFARVDKEEEILESVQAEEQTIAAMPVPDPDAEQAEVERDAADADAEADKPDVYLPTDEE